HFEAEIVTAPGQPGTSSTRKPHAGPAQSTGRRGGGEATAEILGVSRYRQQRPTQLRLRPRALQARRTIKFSSPRSPRCFAQSVPEAPDSAFFRMRFNTSGKPPFFMMRLKLER